jgi:hypothetical protein
MTHDLTDKGMEAVLKEEYAKCAHSTAPFVEQAGQVWDAAIASLTRIRDAAYEAAAQWHEREAENCSHDALYAATHTVSAMAIRSLSKPLEKENG